MKRKLTYTTSLGSVSSGTMRPEDLIPAFAGELRMLMKACRVEREQRKWLTRLLADCANDPTGADPDQPNALIGDLSDALETFAPPYCYFGAHPGDGADYGFWPTYDGTNLPKINDQMIVGNEHRPLWGLEVMIIGVHGSVDCGRFDKRGRFHTYWSVV